MRMISKVIAAASLVALVATPALANPKLYCQAQARHAANFQAAGKTVIGAGVGCLLGAIIAKKCGVGAAVGGVTGFAIGGSKWKKVYHHVYWQCRHS